MININIKNWIVALFTLLFLNSCTEDFLDRAPTAALDKEKAFSDLRLARQYQLGLYKSLTGGFQSFQQDDNSTQFGLDFISQMDGHCIGSRQNNSTVDLIGGSWTMLPEGGNWGSSLEVARRWKKLYKYIRSINVFLENYTKVPLTTPAEEKEMNLMVGEAYFLRAHNYFELVKRWGGVPLVYKTLDVNDEQRLPRAGIRECIDSIVADCNRGASLMDVKVSSAQWVGKMTKGAALGLKARALLLGASPYWSTHGSAIEYSSAASAALDVINLNEYSLMPKYRDVFMTNFNTEEIYFFNDEVKICWKFADMVPFALGGWSNGNQMPTQEFIDCYEIKNSAGQYVPFDKNNPDHMTNMYNTSRRDPRFNDCVLYHGAKWQGLTCDYSLEGKFGPGYPDNWHTGYNFKKYLSEDVYIGGETGKQQGWRALNWIFLRYADILLMYAEAQNQVGGPTSSADGSAKTALWAINQVRARAGVTDLPAGISKEDFDVRLRNERAVELVIEDIRYFDVKRWGIADVLGQDVHKVEITKKTNGTYNFDFSKTTGCIRANYTNPDQYHLYPIQIEEIRRNPNLVQNPGWADIMRTSN